MPLPTYSAIRYVLPLREGGSLPAIVDTDEPGQYVVKFRGAGQGPRALVAEVIAAGLAALLELPVPGAALIEVSGGFGLTEPNPEIQDLLRWSAGTNFGVRYLSGAIGFDPLADRGIIDGRLASAIVWFDAYITNVDRGARNPNILVCEGRPWLIDHGAALYFHHAPGDWLPRSQDAFALIRDHILLSSADDLAGADARLAPLITQAALASVVDAVPEAWLGAGAVAQKRSYVHYLRERLLGGRPWVEEAERARRS